MPTQSFTGMLSPTPGIQYNIWEGRYYGGDYYFHFKTNIPYSSWAMFRIEAVGYSYGGNLPIRCVWDFHTSYGSGIYNTSRVNYYSGLDANGIYNSSDNFIVVRAYGASYYSGWSLNAYTLNPTGTFNVQITAVSQNANSGNYY